MEDSSGNMLVTRREFGTYLVQRAKGCCCSIALNLVHNGLHYEAGGVEIQGLKGCGLGGGSQGDKCGSEGCSVSQTVE